MFSWKQRSLTDKFILFLLSLLMMYPAVDYILRNKIPIPVLGSFWDDLTLLSLLFFAGISLIFSREKRTSRISSGIGLLLLIGFAYTVMDLKDFSVNLEGFRAMFQFMLAFFAGFYLVRDNEDTKLLLNILVLLGALMALYGIYQYVTGAPMPARWVNAGEELRTRAFSITTSPNVLGSQMAFLTPIALGFAAAEKSWTKRLLWLACAGLTGLCLVFTFSRGAWLAFAGALAVIGILYDRRLLIAGIVAAVLVVIFVPSVSTRITSMFTLDYFEKSAGSGRIKRWFDAYDQMRLEPLFGVGLGHHGGAVANRHFGSIYTDNYYMKTLAETGLLGLSLFLWLIGRVLHQAYKTWQTLTDPRWRFVAAGVFGGLLAIVFHNAVENIFETPYMNIYFWLTLGLLAGMPANEQRAGGISHE